MAANESEGDYRVQGKLGEGTFSQVLRMKHRVTGRTLAMKRFKKRFKSIEEVECLREIQALRRVNPHPNLVQMEDILFDTTSGTLYLAFELMDCNLYDLISKKGTVITENKVKVWFFQICKGLEFLHSKGIFHRDIKPENILIRDGIAVKLADLGSCRGIHSKGPFTEYIATRWYRSPETLLTSGRYNYKMDMWGAGCVLYETITKQPLFPGADALDQLHRIHRVFGSPNDSQLRAILGPKMEGKFTFPPTEGTGLVLTAPYDGECRSLLLGLLHYIPEDRLSATQSLAHAFFAKMDLSELPQSMLAVYQGQVAPQAGAAPAIAADTTIAHAKPLSTLAAASQPPHAHGAAEPAEAVGTHHPYKPAAAAATGPAMAAVVTHAVHAAAAAAGGPIAPAAPTLEDLAASRDKLTEGYLQRLLQRRKKEGAGPGNSSYGKPGASNAGYSKNGVPLLPTLPAAAHHATGYHGQNPGRHGLAPAAAAVAASTGPALMLPQIGGRAGAANVGLGVTGAGLPRGGIGGVAPVPGGMMPGLGARGLGGPTYAEGSYLQHHQYAQQYGGGGGTIGGAIGGGGAGHHGVGPTGTNSNPLSDKWHGHAPYVPGERQAHPTDDPSRRLGRQGQ